MLRAVALSLTLLFAGHAYAAGARVMVCRYSGKVMEDCPCPPGGDDARVQKQACCEVRQSLPFHPTAMTGAPFELQRFDVTLPAAPGGDGKEIVALHRAWSVPRSQAPPDDSRRYLRLGLLLI